MCVKVKSARLRVRGKRLPADTLATTPHQCTAIDSCREKRLQLQNHSKIKQMSKLRTKINVSLVSEKKNKKKKKVN